MRRWYVQLAKVTVEPYSHSSSISPHVHVCMCVNSLSCKVCSRIDTANVSMHRNRSSPPLASSERSCLCRAWLVRVFSSLQVSSCAISTNYSPAFKEFAEVIVRLLPTIIHQYLLPCRVWLCRTLLNGPTVLKVYTTITQYGSTVYIGIAMVYPH